MRREKIEITDDNDIKRYRVVMCRDVLVYADNEDEAEEIASQQYPDLIICSGKTELY